jgi:hypothetical protein
VQLAIGSPPSVKSTVQPVWGTGDVVIDRVHAFTLSTDAVGLVSMVTLP